MPQTVEIPGQGVAEFPDEMTPDQIKGVIHDKFFSQPQTPAQYGAQIGEAQPPPTGLAGRVAEEIAKPGLAVIKTAGEYLKGFPSMAKFIAPPTLTDILGGAAETLGQIKTARESPIGSQEWWNAVVPVASQYAMQLGAMRVGSPKLTETLFGKKPPVQTAPLAAEVAAESEVIKNASQKPSAERIPSAQVRPGVDEKAPLRQQGQTPEVREKAQEKPVAPVPQPEQPVSESGQTPAVSGQPKIISTAFQSGDTIIRGEGFEPHDSIAARVASERRSPTQETGKVTPEYEHLKKGITNWYDPNATINAFGKLNDDGSISIPVQRFGVASTDATRGGTWYELNRGGVSDYNALPETGAAKLVGNVATKYGVGGKERVESEVRTRNPFLVNATNLHEGQYPLSLAKKVLTDAEFRKAKRGITGANAEKAYSRLEKLTSQRLKEQGYDAVIFYHKYDYGSIPHQVFKLPQEGVPVPEGRIKPSSVAAAQQRIPENQKGFIIREPDGTERFTNDRSEAARVANAAGQVKPENAGTTELHSQQLASPVKVGPSGATAEDWELKPGFKEQYPKVALKVGEKVYSSEDVNHAALAERHGFPKNSIPGWIDKQGDFVYQYAEDVPVSTGGEAPTVLTLPATPHPAVADFQEHAPSSAQSLGIILPRPSEFVRQDVSRVVMGISKGFRQIKAALTPANVSPIAGQTARIVREHAGQLARDNEIAMTALRDAAQVMRRNSKAENLAIIDRLEKGQPLGNKGLDDYKTIRQSAYDQRIKQVQDVNPKALQDLIENYFPHLWTRESIERLKGNIDNIPADNPWGRIFGKRPLTGPASFLKQRTIPTTAEGIALGLEPVTTNPVALDLLKMHEMDRYVMGHKIMQEMKDNGLAKFVPTGERPDFGYVKINDRIARVFGPRGWKIVDEEGRQMPGQKVLGDYYAPEDAARIINNYLSPGLRGNAVYDAFRFVGNAMNQVQLGISAYHAFFTAIDSATSTIALGLEQIARSGGSVAEIAKGAGQIAKGFIETPVGSMIENLWRGNKFLREYSKPGTTNAELAKIVDTAVSGGSRVRMDTFYNTGAVERFFDALKSGNYTGAVLRAPLALVQTISKPLMEYTVPRLKLGIISQQLEYELSKLPKNATQDQVRIVAGRVVDSVDNRMGQLIYDNLFWNKALKDGLMASVRSVGWNLGDIRELGGGALDSITAPKRAYTALTKGTEIADNPVFTKRMAYTFALPFYVGVLGSVYQYLMTGKGPQSIQDAFMPRTGRRKPDGTEERVMLPTYMKDVYPLALATAREGGVGLVSRGYRMAVNKLHPALSSIGQMIHNQDYYGNQILSPDDPLIAQHPTMGKIFREAEFIGKQFQPFSFRGVAQREGGLKEKLQAVAGIMPATRELTDTPAMRMIHDINMAKRPSGGYTQAQQRKREDRRKAQKGEDLRPMLFKRLSNEEKARVLEVATPEERAIFQSGTTTKRSGRLQMQ